MKVKISGTFFSIALILLLINGCGTSQNDNRRNKNVFVSILPQKYFIERIGGDLLAVHVMVGPGQSPHTYEPTPAQLAALAESDIYFSIGIPLENQILARLEESQAKLQLINTTGEIRLRKIETGYHDQHDDHENHDTIGDDPHTWLDPMMALTQSKVMHDALAAEYPEYKEAFKAGFDNLKADLIALDSVLSRKLEPFKGSRLYVYHPAFGYFADRYGLIQTPVEIEGKEPTAGSLVDLVESAGHDNPKMIFVQPQFSSSLAERIAETIGAVAVSIDPLAYNYIDNLMNITDKITLGYNTNE